MVSIDVLAKSDRFSDRGPIVVRCALKIDALPDPLSDRTISRLGCGFLGGCGAGLTEYVVASVLLHETVLLEAVEHAFDARFVGLRLLAAAAREGPAAINRPCGP